jgi:hypothetical protein
MSLKKSPIPGSRRVGRSKDAVVEQLGELLRSKTVIDIRAKQEVQSLRLNLSIPTAQGEA